MTGKGPAVILRGVDNKGLKVKIPEVEHGAAYDENSLAKRKKGQYTTSPSGDATDGFDTVWIDSVREINHLFTKYSEILRERAAIDAAQVEELENILTEAISLQSQLKEKKEHLRRSLAMISDKLQE